jgi:hypothetical protein
MDRWHKKACPIGRRSDSVEASPYAQRHTMQPNVARSAQPFCHGRRSATSPARRRALKESERDCRFSGAKRRSPFRFFEGDMDRRQLRRIRGVNFAFHSIGASPAPRPGGAPRPKSDANALRQRKRPSPAKCHFHGLCEKGDGAGFETVTGVLPAARARFAACRHKCGLRAR